MVLSHEEHQHSARDSIREILLSVMGVDRPHVDTLRGQYLCEQCGDAMTDTIVPAEESPSGDEIALCALCLRTGRGHTCP